MVSAGICKFASWIACLLSLAAAHAVVLPTATRMEVRLKTRVASNSSQPNDPVEAVLIQPVVIGGQIVVPAGTGISGSVKKASPITKPDERATLELAFSKLGGVTVEAQVVAVDNARESVDQTGRIVGILGSETLTARLDQQVGKVQQKYSKLGGFLETVKSAVFKESDPEIVYEPGVEMTLTLTKAAGWKNAAAPGAALEPLSPETELYEFVSSQPFQTTTEEGTASDLTNLMFLGTEEQLKSAFGAAGWVTAAQLSAVSGLEVVRAVAESRGYKEAPVSTLLLDGKKPDLVFQKQNNTFAMRHHLRVWRRPASFHDRPVWVCAATHDIGIEFSPEKRNFIHKIDPEIDRERAKVASDLAFSGHVKALSLVARPAAPQHSQNATGDKLETDGRMVVLAFD